MKKVPKRSIFHVVIEKKVANWRQSISMQADYVSVSDTPYGLKFCLKLAQVVRRLVVKSLNGKRSGSFQSAFVYRARSTISNNELFAKVVGNSHYIIQ